MQCLEREVLHRWQQEPGFRRLALRDAVAKQQMLLPAYPGVCDQASAICSLGYRWFATEAEAIADAIHRASSVEPDLNCTLEGEEWSPRCGPGGRWSVPGRPWSRALVVVDYIARSRRKHVRALHLS